MGLRLNKTGIVTVLVLLLSACGGGGGGGGGGGSTSSGSGGGVSGSVGNSPPPTPAPANVVPVVLDAGPPQAGGAVNIPYVSVKVCVPGTTVCQTIDHVIVDTGSVGLRLISPGVVGSNLALPAVTDSLGRVLGECEVFADGFVWGTVRHADVYLAGELAAEIPIHTIGDLPGGTASAPADCSNTGGADKGSVSMLRGNGILGIGLFATDCDACSTSFLPIAATYYWCSGPACTGTTVTKNQAVKNPVTAFAQDNNGVILDLPAVGDSGAANPTGSLTFGIGTQANNGLGSATVYAADSFGQFTTTYKGATMPSFIDSGSNALYFPDSSLPHCKNSPGFYCPAAPATLTATNTAANGSATGVVNFGIVNLDALGVGTTAVKAGGNWTGGTTTFDWGIPFFFGRKVYTAIDQAATPAGQGPYWAY